MYNYKVELGYELVDLDRMMYILKDGGDCHDSTGGEVIEELKYLFGEGGYKFIIDTLQEQVDNIKARQPSAEK